jgi:hypothetical protein
MSNGTGSRTIGEEWVDLGRDAVEAARTCCAFADAWHSRDATKGVGADGVNIEAKILIGGENDVAVVSSNNSATAEARRRANYP